MNLRIARVVALVAAAWALFVSASLHAGIVDDTITYQGQLLEGGQPVTDNCDFRVKLFDALTNGTQIGTTQQFLNQTMSSDGTVTLSPDFGLGAFDGSDRWLEIEVRNPAGQGNFVILTPRQQVRATPYALHAVSVEQVSNDALIGMYDNALDFTNASNSYAGSGASLTGLNASNINAGTMNDARLSNNVGFLAGAQTFSGVKTFSAPATFTSAGAPFSVASNTLVGNLNADLIDGLNSTAFGQLAMGNVWNGINSFGNAGNSFTGSGAGLTGVNADLLDGLNSTAFLQSVPVPLSLSGSNASALLEVTNSSTNDFSAAIFGRAFSSTGITVAGLFSSDSPQGIAVRAATTATSGSNIAGDFSSNSVGGTGVRAVSAGPFGVVGSSNLASGIAVGGEFSSASTSGRGVRSIASAATGFTFAGDFTSLSSAGTGVRAVSNGPYGVVGVSNFVAGFAVAGEFTCASPEGFGVRGYAPATFGSTVGGYFQCDSSSGIAVQGNAFSSVGTTYGGYFQNASPNGFGAYATNSASGAVGVLGRVPTAGSGLGHFGVSTGVWGDTDTGNGVLGTASSGTGVAGYSASGHGVTGVSESGAGIGMYGQGPTYGVFSAGNFGASGSKSFRIDHPDDPENMYLLHYCHEGPEPQNVYNGVVSLDAAGQAWVELPEYFDAINRDPRYLLTPIGAAMPNLHIAEEIEDGVFLIAGGAPGK